MSANGTSSTFPRPWFFMFLAVLELLSAVGNAGGGNDFSLSIGFEGSERRYMFHIPSRSLSLNADFATPTIDPGDEIPVSVSPPVVPSPPQAVQPAEPTEMRPITEAEMKGLRVSDGLRSGDEGIIASGVGAEQEGPGAMIEKVAEISVKLAKDGKIDLPEINFPEDSAELPEGAAATLEVLLGVLKTNPKLKIRIEGHTDSSGDPARSQPLSEERASAVKAWLVLHGAVEIQIRAVGFGESQPKGDNATIEGRALNRRVTIVVE